MTDFDAWAEKLANHVGEKIHRRAWERGTKEHAAMFGCRVCGEDCATSPGPGQAVCEAHCEDHDYEYERSEREWHCKHCFAVRPYDMYAYGD